MQCDHLLNVHPLHLLHIHLEAETVGLEHSRQMELARKKMGLELAKSLQQELGAVKAQSRELRDEIEQGNAISDFDGSTPSISYFHRSQKMAAGGVER